METIKYMFRKKEKEMIEMMQKTEEICRKEEDERIERKQRIK